MVCGHLNIQLQVVLPNLKLLLQARWSSIATLTTKFPFLFLMVGGGGGKRRDTSTHTEKYFICCISNTKPFIEVGSRSPCDNISGMITTTLISLTPQFLKFHLPWHPALFGRAGKVVLHIHLKELGR